MPGVCRAGRTKVSQAGGWCSKRDEGKDACKDGLYCGDYHFDGGVCKPKKASSTKPKEESKDDANVTCVSNDECKSGFCANDGIPGMPGVCRAGRTKVSDVGGWCSKRDEGKNACKDGLLCEDYHFDGGVCKEKLWDHPSIACDDLGAWDPELNRQKTYVGRSFFEVDRKAARTCWKDSDSTPADDETHCYRCDDCDWEGARRAHQQAECKAKGADVFKEVDCGDWTFKAQCTRDAGKQCEDDGHCKNGVCGDVGDGKECCAHGKTVEGECVRVQGQTCTRDGVCQESHECRTAADGQKKCFRVRFQTRGQPCSHQNDCMQDLVCYNDKCRVPRETCTAAKSSCASDTTCRVDDDCASGHCVDGTCRAYGTADSGSAAFGEWCGRDEHCGLTEDDRSMTCTADNNTCEEVCTADEYKSDGRCLAKLATGALCSSTAQCATGVCGWSGRCQPDCKQETLQTPTSNFVCTNGTLTRSYVRTHPPNDSDTTADQCDEVFEPQEGIETSDSCTGGPGDVCQSDAHCTDVCYQGGGRSECAANDGCLHDDVDCEHIQMIADPPAEGKTGWLQVGQAFFKDVHAFSLAESAKITTALSSPGSFVFTDAGHLKYGSTKFTNPATDVARAFPSAQSLKRLQAAHPKQFVYDDHNVISRNLQWILHRAGDGQWHLLYNPMHRQGFRDYYARVRASADAGMVSWGATTLADVGHVNLKTFFRNYCAAFHVTKPDGTKAHLDPTCNMFLSAERCAKSAFFDDNVLDLPELDETVTNGLSAGTPPNCLCVGNPYDYATSEVPATSFLHDFLKSGETCAPNIINQVCEINMEALVINIEDSTLSNNCNAQIDDGPLSPTDDTLSPTDVPLSPTDATLSPTDVPLSPTDDTLSPTDDPLSPSDDDDETLFPTDDPPVEDGLQVTKFVKEQPVLVVGSAAIAAFFLYRVTRPTLKKIPPQSYAAYYP